MAKPLRLLIIEDNEDDAFLLIRHLGKGGYVVDHQRVETGEAMWAAIQRRDWDLIAADYSLPRFSPYEALALLKQSKKDIPFIVVSGVVGEDTAVLAMKAGASDYIRKDNLARLIPAIERELGDAAVRSRHRAMEAELRKSQRILATLMSNLPGMAYRCRMVKNRTMEFVSEGCLELTGYKPDELAKNRLVSYEDLIDPGDRASVRREIEDAVQSGSPYQLVYRIRTARGEIRWVWEKGRAAESEDGIQYLEGFVTDITERKRVENERRLLEDYIRNTLRDGILNVDAECRVLNFNEAALNLLECGAGQIRGAALADVPAPPCRAVAEVIHKALACGEFIREYQITGKSGDRIWTYILAVSPMKREPEGGAVAVIRDISRVRSLETEVMNRYSFRNIVGKSAAMEKVFDRVGQLAATDTTVLIQGPSGTGKELIASALHYQGHRKDGPFVRVNCAALPETLLESELFGHVKGAFTGALCDKYGRFEQAHRGTIFLDEIGDISHKLQLRLLRVLQEREIERVGSSKPVRIDVRIIAATNRNLADLVLTGDFREDLFYRLNVVPIHLPPLRDRKEDIPLLVRHFMAKIQDRLGQVIRGIDPAAMNILLHYGWPGNVRQLENAIEHAGVLTRDGMIRAEHLPPEVREAPKSPPPQSVPPQAAGGPAPSGAAGDGQRLLEVLESVNWNRSEAARVLNVNRNTIWRKIKKYGLNPPEG